MRARVSVVTASPSWGRGIAAGLDDAGLEAVICDTLSDWFPGPSGSAILLWPASEDHVPLEDFTEEHPHIPVVVVVDELEASAFATAIRAGAVAAVGPDDPIEWIVSVVRMALSGLSGGAPQLIAAMASAVPEESDLARLLGEDEVGWLQKMAAGTTVADLALEVGYSERAMFRRLKDLYRRLGVAGRTEALLWASRHGVLDAPWGLQ